MSIARTVAEVLADHTTLELECVDRMYLNVYMPLLQTAGGVAYCRTALCYQRTYARVLRPTLAAVFDPDPPRGSRLKRTVETFDREIDRLWEGHELTA